MVKCSGRDAPEFQVRRQSRVEREEKRATALQVGIFSSFFAEARPRPRVAGFPPPSSAAVRSPPPQLGGRRLWLLERHDMRLRLSVAATREALFSPPRAGLRRRAAGNCQRLQRHRAAASHGAALQRGCESVHGAPSVREVRRQPPGVGKGADGGPKAFTILRKEAYAVGARLLGTSRAARRRRRACARSGRGHHAGAPRSLGDGGVALQSVGFGVALVAQPVAPPLLERGRDHARRVAVEDEEGGAARSQVRVEVVQGLEQEPKAVSADAIGG